MSLSSIICGVLQCSPEELRRLIEKGWSTKDIMRGFSHGLCSIDDFLKLDMWDEKYLRDGEIWGDQPSDTVKTAMSLCSAADLIADIGFGYGRDLYWLARQRGRLSGVETSSIGFRAALQKLRTIPSRTKDGELDGISLIHSYSPEMMYGEDTLDCIYSHRVFHLLDRNGMRQRMATMAKKAVRDGGRLIISARSYHDYYSSKKLLHNTLYDRNGRPVQAEYIDRPGHIVSYFSREIFENLFLPECQIESLCMGREIEAMGNIDDDGGPIYSYFMLATMRINKGWRTGSGESNMAVGYLPSVPTKTREWLRAQEGGGP